MPHVFTGFVERRTAMVEAGHWRDLTLLDHLERQRRDNAEKPAFVCYPPGRDDATSLTLSELDAVSTQLANALLQLGVTRGDVVSMQLPNVWQAAAIQLACLKIGAITNPLMPILRERELRFILRQARTRVLVVMREFRGFDYLAMAEGLKAEAPDLRAIVDIGYGGDDGFERLLAAGGTSREMSPAARPADPDDVAQLLFTSGTTGEPKGVMHSSNTMLSNLIPFAARLGLSGADVVHMPSPIGHQLGFMYGLVMPVMLGATSVLQGVFDPAQMARQIIAHSVSFTMAAPPFLTEFVRHVEAEGVPMESLRIFVSAGAPVPRSLVARSREVLGASVISGWGMSENGAVSITCPDDSIEHVTNTDGCALPGMELLVRREDGSPARADEPGRLFVRGCSNFLGYFARPDLPALDDDGWFDTGDLARMDAAGYIRITGRAKDLVIRGGENIPVVEIEDLISQHDAVRAVAIVPVAHERLGEQAFAFVVLAPGARFDLAAMRDHLRGAGAATHYFPEHLKAVDGLPVTASGKVQKFVLREWARADLERRAQTSQLKEAKS
ncbi:AMP-binding protein [Phenylobacterium sp.]|uniref:AMP-binding protein n=1 Tax=Phenylobacterium sp. TaxID=1871053 RepID=UPI002ED7D9EE